MLNKLRNIAMADDSGPLSGDVEVDEASVDGKPRKPQGQPPRGGTEPDRRSEAAKLRERSRATVFAAVERGGRDQGDSAAVTSRAAAQAPGHRVGRT